MEVSTMENAEVYLKKYNKNLQRRKYQKNLKN